MKTKQLCLKCSPQSLHRRVSVSQHNNTVHSAINNPINNPIHSTNYTLYNT